ncbi:unknown [Clostridium sp. CAG:568]|nr:unknown [Clostridium sp. CAG:568]
MDDDFFEWWSWYLTDEEMRLEEEARKKQLDALLSPTPRDDYEAAKKKWEDNSNVDRFIKETREFLDKLDKEK